MVIWIANHRENHIIPAKASKQYFIKILLRIKFIRNERIGTFISYHHLRTRFDLKRKRERERRGKNFPINIKIIYYFLGEYQTQLGKRSRSRSLSSRRVKLVSSLEKLIYFPFKKTITFTMPDLHRFLIIYSYCLRQNVK